VVDGGEAESTSSPVSLHLLGLPALALALAITTVTTLVPLTLRRLTPSSLLIGVIVAGEGLVALLLPLWVGPLSDRTRTAIGGRLPYVLIGTSLCVPALALLPWAASLASIAILMLIFYTGYSVYYPAYRAVYPDVVPLARFGRSQGIQTLFREVGLTVALTASPVLLALWAPAPFLVGAGVMLAVSLLFVLKLRKRAGVARVAELPSERSRPWPSPAARRALLANALWEFSLSGLKSFVVLYVVIGIGRSPSVASALMAIVAVVVMLAAPIAGRLADRFGTLRVIRMALYLYATGLLLPCFTQSLLVLLPAMPLVGFGGAIVMTLPYALLTEHLPEQRHGASAGWYEFSRGLGASAGPVLTGAAIDLLEPVFHSTHGYAAMWLVQATALLCSLPLLPAASPSAMLPSTDPARPG
jgi:MFS family permease